MQSRDKIARIKALNTFTFMDGVHDRGTGVAELSTRIVDMLKSNKTIRAERKKAKVCVCGGVCV